MLIREFWSIFGRTHLRFDEVAGSFPGAATVAEGSALVVDLLANSRFLSWNDRFRVLDWAPFGLLERESIPGLSFVSLDLASFDFSCALVVVDLLPVLVEFGLLTRLAAPDLWAGFTVLGDFIVLGLPLDFVARSLLPSFGLPVDSVAPSLLFDFVGALSLRLLPLGLTAFSLPPAFAVFALSVFALATLDLSAAASADFSGFLFFPWGFGKFFALELLKPVAELALAELPAARASAPVGAFMALGARGGRGLFAFTTDSNNRRPPK